MSRDDVDDAYDAASQVWGVQQPNVRPAETQAAAAPDDDDPVGAAAKVWGVHQGALAVTAPVVHHPHTGAPAAPTRFQQSTAPSTEPEQSWGDTLSTAAHNFLPSAGGVLKATGSALVHPLDTLGALGDIGKGAVSQAAGALGVEQDPVEKKKTEALIDALEDHYKTAYGSVPGFKKALATDPASVAMDASSVLGGAGLAAKGVGLADTANVLSKTGAAIDPVNAAVQAAKVASKPVMGVLRSAQSLSSGVPKSALKLASAAGASTDPALRDAFNHFNSGVGTPAELKQAATAALGSVKQDMSNQYLAGKAGLSTQPVDLAPIDQAIQAETVRLSQGPSSGFQQGKAALAAVQEKLNEIKANPAKQTLPQMDAFKRQIYDLHDNFAQDEAPKTIDALYHATRNAMAATDPKYTAMMERYQEGLQTVNDLTKSLGLGDKTGATQSAIKMMRATKNNTIGGAGEPLIKQLGAKDPRIPYMLAGMSTKEWAPGGLRNPIEGGALGMVAALHPGALPAMMGQAAMSSPKLAGKVNYAAGAANRLGANPAITKGAYYAGRANQEAQSQDEGDPIFNQMLQIESGNRQSDKKGNTIVSPKGAIGAAQVMPQTGPEAAALAGETYDPERLASDADYNRRLGHAYYKKQLETFGDPYKAAAAYNAGPEAVQRALAQEQRTGTSYLNYVPWETREYVKKLQERTASATGGRITRASGGKVDHQALVQRLMKRWKEVKKGTDRSTEALLKVPDDAIMHALKVSQDAI